MSPLIYNPQAIRILKHAALWLGEAVLWHMAQRALGRRNETIVVEVRVSRKPTDDGFENDQSIDGRSYE